MRRSSYLVVVALLTTFAVTSLADPAAATGPIGGVRTLVSVDATGVLGNGASDSGALSADGRFVAFVSAATNLVSVDTNQFRDVFVKDLETGTTERVSVSTAGAEGNGPAGGRPAISADGRYVAFVSAASNLVQNDQNNESDVFVRDRSAMTTARVSVSGAGAEANAASFQPALSADGAVVAFVSKASNLVAGDTNGQVDVFVRVRSWVAPTTTRVSRSTAGVQGGNLSHDPSVNGDGRFVTFTSYAANLVPGDTNQASDVFLHDRSNGTTSLVSVDTTSGPANGNSANAEISADGDWIAFDSFASDLVASDTNARRDVFLRGRVAATTELVSVPARSRTQGNGDSFDPTVSDNGIVAFSSNATNLVSGDANGLTDVFVRSNSTYASSEAWDSGGPVGGLAPAISADGFALVFTSASADLAPGDTNGATDLFMPNYGSPNCTSSGGGQVACDLTASGGPVPSSVRWYFDGAHDPSLDDMTIVQVALNCQPGYLGIVRAEVASGAGIAALTGLYIC
jgi:Tol biopolymer transport system component